MRVSIVSALVALAHTAAAVTGAAEGFAKGVTGGGSGKTVTPTTNAELVSYLTSSEKLNIVLTRTFDFTGADGTASETGCAPWGTGSTCQLAINKDKWCDNYQPNAKKVAVKYSKAGLQPIQVKSNKSIVGQGSKGIIRGKGLRLSGGVTNIIIQNIKIEELSKSHAHGNITSCPPTSGKRTGANTVCPQTPSTSGAATPSPSTAPTSSGSTTSPPRASAASTSSSATTPRAA